jgi:branched-subunit amino acid ABC-type transport system permease component
VGAFAAFFAATRFATKALGLADTTGYLLSIVVAFGVGAILGLIINAAVFAPLRERGDELRPLIATIGVSVLLENGQLALLGPIPYQFDSPFARETIRIGRIFFTQQSVVVVWWRPPRLRLLRLSPPHLSAGATRRIRIARPPA